MTAAQPSDLLVLTVLPYSSIKNFRPANGVHCKPFLDGHFAKNKKVFATLA